MVKGSSASVSLGQLLAHRQWLQGLARALVRDESRASDLEQEVWLKALEKPPSELRSPRGWLGAVARRAAVDQHRSNRRRRERERVAGAGPRTTSTADLAAQADLQQWVTRAVLALDEPYRGSVLLHYVGGNSIAEVAQLQGVPVETVRTRLRRARETLRERLDRRHGGDRGAWCFTLLPVAEGAGLTTTAGAAVASAAGGVALLGAKSMAVAGLALLLVLGYAVSAALWDGDETVGDSAFLGLVDGYSIETPPEFLEPKDGPVLRGRPLEERADDSFVRPPARSAPLAEPTLSKVVKRVRADAGVAAGVVRDLEGESLPEVRVILWDAAGLRMLDRAWTDTQGAFRFEALDSEGCQLSFHFNWTAFSCALDAGGADLEVRLDLLGSLGGTVAFEGSGTPLAHARVVARRVQDPPDRHYALTWTDEGGAFTLRGLAEGRYDLHVGFVTGAETSGPGHLPKRVGPFEVGAADVLVEVAPGLSIEGTVRGPDGVPWREGATVRVSPVSDTGGVDYETQRSTTVTPEGTFRVGGLEAGAFDLTVVPASGAVDVACAHLPRVPAGSTNLVVDLPAGRRLTGRLVDETGEPVVARGSVWVFLDGSGSGRPGSVEATLGADGRFVTPPLDPGRGHTVHAMGFEGYGDGRRRGVHPGSEEVEVALRRGLRISGQVVNEHGHPINSYVPVQARVVDLEGDDRHEAWSYRATMSDAHGNFTLGGLAHRAYEVWAGGRRSPFVATPEPPVVQPGTRDVKVVVRQGVRLSGRIVVASGDDPRGLVLQARGVGPLRHASSWTRCDRDGAFSFEGVPEASVVVGAEVHGTYRWWGPFQGGATDISLRVRR